MDELLSNPMPNDFKDPSSANCMARSGVSNNSKYTCEQTVLLGKWLKHQLISAGQDPADPTKLLPPLLGAGVVTSAEKNKEAVPLHVIAMLARKWKEEVSQQHASVDAKRSKADLFCPLAASLMWTGLVLSLSACL